MTTFQLYSPLHRTRRRRRQRIAWVTLLALLLLGVLVAGCEERNAQHGGFNVREIGAPFVDDGPVTGNDADARLLHELDRTLNVMMGTQALTNANIAALLARIEKLEKQCGSVRAGSS